MTAEAATPPCFVCVRELGPGMWAGLEERVEWEAHGRVHSSGSRAADARRRPLSTVGARVTTAFVTCAALVALHSASQRSSLNSAENALRDVGKGSSTTQQSGSRSLHVGLANDVTIEGEGEGGRMGVVHLAANGRIELLQLSEPWLASVKPSGQAGARVQRLQTLKQLPSQPVPSVQSAESGNWGKGTISIGPAQVQGSGEIAPAGKFTYLQAPRVHPRRPRNRYNYCECTERVCAHEMGSYALALYKHPVSVRARTINEYHHALESRWTRGQELANYRGPRAFRKPKLARGLGKRARVCQRTGPGRTISNHPSCLALGSISLPCVCSTVLFVATHNPHHLARAAGERAAAAGASASTAR